MGQKPSAAALNQTVQHGDYYKGVSADILFDKWGEHTCGLKPFLLIVV